MDTTAGCADASGRGDYALRIFDSRPYRQAVSTALTECGRVERRDCPLKAELMVSLVVALSLYRSLSIPDVFRKLVCLLGAHILDGRLESITPEALLRAKARLGPQVLPQVFEAIAADIEVRPSFHGHRVFALDGVRFSVDDNDLNEAAFGRCKSSNGAKTAFPQFLAVLLLAVETKEIKAVHLDTCTGAERPACQALLEQLTAGDLVIKDRGLYAVWLFEKFVEKSIHFVTRGFARGKVEVLERLGRGDYLVRVVGLGSAGAAKTGRKKIKLVLRMIEYRVGRRERVRLFTTLTDPKIYPAREIACLYHKRWECELAFDEMKTHLAKPPTGAVQLTFRSRSPDLVLQEAYGLFIAYNLIRATMAAAACVAGIPANEISFVGTINTLDRRCASIEAMYGELQEAAWKELLAEIGNCRLRKRRGRQYPRVIRVKIRRFPRKRAWHRQLKVDHESKLQLVNKRSQSRTSR